MNSAPFIGIGIIALVVLYFRFHPRYRGTRTWREAMTDGTHMRTPFRRLAAEISGRTNVYRDLSLTARTAVALVCFERWCRVKGLRHPLIDAFLNEMWEVPCMKSLPDWEEQNGVLAGFARGDKFPDAMREPLQTVGVDEDEFKRVVENCVEIFYCSAYAGTDNAASLQALDQVLYVTAAAGVTPPPVQPFLLSRFTEVHGWGEKLSPEQRDGWRFGTYETAPLE